MSLQRILNKAFRVVGGHLNTFNINFLMSKNDKYLFYKAL